MDKKALFRQKSYEHINSPEKLDQYLEIPGANTWMLITALFIVVFVTLLWGIFGSVPKTVEAVGIRTNRGITCFVSSQEAFRVKPGMKIVISDDDNSIIGKVDLVGMSVTYENAGAAVNAPWLLEHSITETEWVTSVIVRVENGEDEELAKDAELNCKVIVEEQAPYQILFN